MTTDRIPLPPSHLSERAQALWVAVAGPYSGLPRLAMLRAALESLDRADQARERIAVDGLMADGGGKIQHCHPLLRIEADARKQFVDVWTRLGLHATTCDELMRG